MSLKIVKCKMSFKIHLLDKCIWYLKKKCAISVISKFLSLNEYFSIQNYYLFGDLT